MKTYKPHTMSAQWQTITPEHASQLLELNNDNRSIRNRSVQRYSDAMSDGRWLPTNDAICIGDDGRLLNGQHRLHAVIKSGVPIVAIVATGVPSESFRAMDRGAVRSVRDLANISGIPNPKVAPTAAQAVAILSAWAGETANLYGSAKNAGGSSIDHDILLGWIMENRDEIEASASIAWTRRGRRMSSFFNGIHFAIGEKNQEWFEDVMSKVSTGLGIELNSTEHHISSLLDSSDGDRRWKILKAVSYGADGKSLKFVRKTKGESLTPPTGWAVNSVLPCTVSKKTMETL